MAISPLRKLGQLGVNTDVDPFDLPPSAFTMACNARFEDNRITRSPVFATSATLDHANPSYVISYNALTGGNTLLVVNKDGTIYQWNSGSSFTLLTVSGWTPAATTQPYTCTIESNVIYLNRPDQVPWYMVKGGSQFAVLPNWPVTWRTGALRSFNGQLVAIGVTQGANNYPTMVAWSDYTLWSAYPQYWQVSATNAAGSNVLADCGDPLVDGLPLRNNFILYSGKETWAMTPTGSNTSLFSFSRLFDSNLGVINQNCVVEANNMHYVFGPEKIWMHDGYTPKDLTEGRVYTFIYSTMDLPNCSQFFVQHVPRLNEVMFCYRSFDPFCAFPIGGVLDLQGCNKAAVFNYRANTWYFYDMPYVTSSGFDTPTSAATYSSLAATRYSSMVGAYSSYQSSSKLTLFMTLNGATNPGGLGLIDSFELHGSAYSAGVIDTANTAPVSLYRSQFDLDSIGASLRGYKILKSVYPEGRVAVDAAPMSFSFSSSDYPNIPEPAFSAPMTFDGSTLYKLDFQSAGRYMGMKITYPDYRNFSLSGLDLDFEVLGNR